MTTRRIDSHRKGVVGAICTLALLIVPASRVTAESDGPPIAIAKLDRTTTVDFESEILPIFRSSCLACHNRKRAKADLILETPADILKGSENGDVVNPEHGAESSLLQVAAHQVKPMMPPKDNKVSAPDLTPAQLGLLRLWIDQGAKGEVRGIGPIRWQPPAATLQPIDAVALSPDGRWAAAGRANRIHIYDLPTTRSATTLLDPSLGAPSEKIAHRDIVQSLAFSPDGNLLASGAYGEIKLWRRPGPTSKSVTAAPATAPTTAPTTAPVRVPAALLAHGAPAAALAARPDGKAFVCVGDDRVARLWDLEKGVAIAEIKCSALAARKVAKRERTMQLAAGEVAYYKSIVEKAQTNQKASEDRLTKSTAAKSAAEKVVTQKQAVLAKAAAGKSSADAALVADPELQRADQLAQAAERVANEAQELAANAKASSAAAPLLEALAGSADAGKKAAVTVRAAATAIAAQPRLKPLTDQAAVAEKAREAADAEVQAALRESATAATEFKLAENAVRKGTEELTGAKAGLAAAQEAHKKTETDFAAAQQAMKSADVPIRAAAFSADNQFLATAGEDGFIHLWGASTGILLESIPSPSTRSLAFTKDGDLIAVNVDGATTRWSLGASWRLVRVVGSGDSNSALTDRVNALQFSPDGTLLASGSGEPSRGGQIKLWDPNSGQLLRSFDDVHSDAVLALDFSPDGKQLASGAADRFVRVLDLKSGKVTRSLEGHTHHVLGVSWKPDGRTLASSGADNQIKIWDVAAADRRAAVAGFGKEVSGVHFYGTQGEAIAVAGDGQIKIVNETGGTVRALQTLGDFLQAAAITADGRTLIVGGQSGVLTVWKQLTDPPAMAFAP
jgi:WD40 repeat protein